MVVCRRSVTTAYVWITLWVIVIKIIIIKICKCYMIVNTIKLKSCTLQQMEKSYQLLTLEVLSQCIIYMDIWIRGKAKKQPSSFGCSVTWRIVN